MIKNGVQVDDFFFHSVHGLCRVAGVTRSAQPADTSYSLVPVLSNKANIRFTIPMSSLEESGFSKLISVKEAHSILEYIKTGKKKESQCGQAWSLAVTIWTEAFSKDVLKDARKRQTLSRAAKGLASELAFVLNSTVAEIAAKIQKNLGSISKINPLVLTVLANVEDE